MNHFIKGIIPPVPTPLIDNKTLDVKGLENLLEHLLSGGVHGLFILGTTGEATSLSYRLRKELIKRTSEYVKNRIPVVVGITDTSFDNSVEIAEYSAGMGLDGVVVAPPYYMPVSQEEMRQYLENLVPVLPLPFLMYNMPDCTKLHMSLETIKVAKELGAIGIKDSSGNMPYLFSIIEEFKNSPNFSVITGTEAFLPETIMHGGHGAVAGGANLFPGLFIDLYNASMEKDTKRIASLLEKVLLIESTIYSVGRHKSAILKGIKCALSVMGICNGYVAFPFRQFDNKEQILIKRHIDELMGILK
jgi:dihydrodipicolinate synthase/N-acetylneuraminate lyase